MSYSTVRDYRWVASRWPAQHRRADVSHTIHKILAGITGEQERFEAVKNPPPNPGGGPGPARWTHDGAKRMVGWKVGSPESVQERVEAIHDLATDDAVAAVVTTDFLRRPAVASKAMADDTARHMVNEAQFDRFRQQSQFGREGAAPQLERMEHSAQFMDLVAACAQFVAAAGRIVPNLRGTIWVRLCSSSLSNSSTCSEVEGTSPALTRAARPVLFNDALQTARSGLTARRRPTLGAGRPSEGPAYTRVVAHDRPAPKPGTG